ncbi:MAG: DUF1501 domain-containing protein [Planctomycetota bacterium]
MKRFDRRDLLRLGALGAFTGHTDLFRSALRAACDAGTRAPSTTASKVLFIFLRGGNDGVSTVIPFGDATYTTARTATAIDPVASHPLRGTGYAKLHPRLGDMLPADAAGHIAWIHQTGMVTGSRSHFSKMQMLETAEERSEDDLAREGFVPRLRAVAAGFESTLPAASVALRMQRMFASADPDRILAHIRSFNDYTLGSDLLADQLRGNLHAHFGDTATNAIDTLERATGRFMIDSEQAIALLRPQHASAPVFDVNPPGLTPSVVGRAFLTDAEQALYLLLHSDCRVAGVDFGGFDTHRDQQAQHSLRMEYLGYCMGQIYAATIGQTALDITTVVITEFGRTAWENASQGTDHGVGALAMVQGVGVRGGVYNCASPQEFGFGSAWTPLTGSNPPPFEDATPVATHVFTLLAELFVKRFGVSPGSQLDTIIPGYSAMSGSLFTPLDYLL